MRLLLICLLMFGLLGCSPLKKHTKNLTSPAKSQGTVLNQLNDSFLFMAAQDAMVEGNSQKAIKFLRVLVEKDPKALQPRMQLIELLLHHGIAEEALSHTQALLNMDLQEQQRSTLMQLQVRTLLLMQRYDQAIQLAHSFLKKQPEHLGMRITLVRLYMEKNQFSKALHSIHVGLKMAENDKLRLLQVRLLMAQQKYSAAETALQILQQRQPKNPILFILASELAEAAKQPKRAEKILRDFLTNNKNSLSIHHALAKLFMRLKREQEAIQLYQDLQQRVGQNTAISTAMGLIYFQLEQYADAEQHFQQALKEEKSATTRFYLGLSLEAQHKSKQAIQHYQQFKAHESFYPKAQMRLAIIAFEQKKLDKSASILQHLIKNSPDYLSPYDLLFNIRSIQEAYQVYLDESQHLVKKSDKSDINILFNRAIAFEKLKNIQGMEQSLRAILKQQPEHSESLNFLGYAFAERGIKLDEAETLIQRALTLKPKDGYYLDSLAWVYYQRQEYHKALQHQQQAVTIVNDDPIMFEHLGDIFFQLQQPKHAHTAWLKAIELKHSQPDMIQRKLDQ